MDVVKYSHGHSKNRCILHRNNPKDQIWTVALAIRISRPRLVRANSEITLGAARCFKTVVGMSKHHLVTFLCA